MTGASSLSTHVLDAVRGRPATGVRVELASADGGEWTPLGGGVTDDDGRIAGLAPEGLPSGTFRLVFATGDYFAAVGDACFYPEVSVAFLVDEERHYHVPLLLSPYAFSTYRGS